MNKKVLKELEKEYSISLKSFLIIFCGICNDTLLKGKVSHDDIKHLFPELKRVSFDYINKNINEIYTGKVILVKDSYDFIVPYKKPLIEKYIEIPDIEIVEEKCEEAIEEIVNLENLSLYELSELGKKYKEEKRLTEYRSVCRLIKKINNESGIKEFHKRKEKIKEMNYNDKY